LYCGPAGGGEGPYDGYAGGASSGSSLLPPPRLIKKKAEGTKIATATTAITTPITRGDQKPSPLAPGVRLGFTVAKLNVGATVGLDPEGAEVGLDD